MEGRNLAHAGCLVGLIIGLGGGIIIAWNLIVYGFLPAVALSAWGIAVVIFGGIGYAVGSRYIVGSRNPSDE